MLTKIKEHIQYPKLILLCFSIFLAYFLFKIGFISDFEHILNGTGYVAVFLAGLLFAYGFTAPFAVAMLVTISPEINIYLGALLAGFGAFISDLIIFTFIRTSFQDEFDKLKLTMFFQRIHELFHHHLSDKLKEYTLWTLAGFLIASPLPDEFGVSLVSGFTQINRKTFSIISFCLNTLGIFFILVIA